MSAAAPLEFFFFYGSIHSYLATMRIEAVAERAGVTVRWRPFNLREILIEQNDTGFTGNEAFHDWFIERRAPGVGDHVERILSSAGKSADIIARAEGAEGARLMQEATDDARKLGIFGAPTFAIGTEIFWGADRLEDAVAFAAGR